MVKLNKNPDGITAVIIIEKDGQEWAVDTSELLLDPEDLTPAKAKELLIAQPMLDQKYGMLKALVNYELREIQNKIKEYERKKFRDFRPQMAEEYGVKVKDVKDKWISEILLEDEEYQRLCQLEDELLFIMDFINYGVLKSLEDRRIALNRAAEVSL